MKLAEALSIRKELQTRIDQLKVRTNNNVRVQEGEEPAEEPQELLKELDSCLKQLQDLIYRINLTNMHATSGKKTLTQLMEENRVAVNRDLPNYSQISAIELVASEFEKTPKRSIKRYLYS